MMTQQKDTYSKALTKLLEGITSISSTHDIHVQGITLNSQEVGKGDCFVALQGERVHGLQYVDRAVAAGANVVLSDEYGKQYTPEVECIDVPIIFIDGLREKLAGISNRFYDNPSERITTLAITGTNGKTTIASVVAEVFEQTHGSAAYIGTLGVGLWRKLESSVNTTPDVLTVQRNLAEFCGEGIKVCAIEASSHALVQNRLDGIQTDVAIFTNLTHEHLDYHGSMEAYGKAKLRLFDGPSRHCAPPLNAVVNLDDPFGKKILEQLDPATIQWPFTTSHSGIVHERLTSATDIEASLKGIKMYVSSPVGEGLIHSKLIGQFNVSNLLATIASLSALKWTFSDIQKALAEIGGAPGRMDLIRLAEVPACCLPSVVIDYAHSPDALKQVLTSLRELTPGRLICVFGCGGDRDKDKRRLMGAIAEKFADIVVVTTDNPRGEQPMAIMEQIVAGQVRPGETLQEEERESAIRKAIAIAHHEDVVLIAGKGHETHQVFGNNRIPFSDYEVSRVALSERYSGADQ